MMYQHHQGARSSGQPLAGAVPLYPYSGIGMEMQGLGMDLGEPTALYPYSGLGMDLGGLVDGARDWFDGLPMLAKLAVAALGVAGVMKLWKSRRKIKSALGLSKARRNGGRRRKVRRARRNGTHTHTVAAPAKRNRRKVRRSKSRRNSRHAMPARNSKGRFVKGRRNGAARRRRSR
jgi:hypothetical protein